MWVVVVSFLSSFHTYYKKEDDELQVSTPLTQGRVGMGPPSSSFVALILLFFHFQSCFCDSSDYLVGLGSYDVTGPAADVNMMGYAQSSQIAAGIHFRLHARTFIVAHPDDGSRVAFVNLDACMASQLVRIKVLERLRSRYGDLYNQNNVAISGIHTHSGPGGYLQYVVYLVTSLGFVRQSFDAIVDGIEKSFVEAHDNLRPGSIYLNQGELPNAGINRSPSAYLANPASERSNYAANIDTTMTLIKFVDNEWGPIGTFNWFATHGTSMTNNNSLISGDNKGAAARFMEDWASKQSFLYDGGEHQRRVSSMISSSNDDNENGDSEFQRLALSFPASRGEKVTTAWSMSTRVRSPSRQPANKPKFVAAFCQSNCGDVSPNVLGAFCIDTGLPCDFNHSTCNGKNELCIGRGPGYPDDFESTRIIGERQFAKAVELLNGATEKVVGKIDYRHTYLNLSAIQVGEGGVTCPAAMGFAFAAGTTDGIGAFDFRQGDNKGNAFWRLVRDFLKAPSKEQIECQNPKPILLDTGEMTFPYAWAPSILPIQIIRIGKLVILCVPSEFTTMAGRRLRESVKATLISYGGGEFDDDVRVVIAGLTNSYSQYVTTIEEYEVQRYEGASTLYGPRTLSAYIQEFTKLATALAMGDDVLPGPPPPDLLDEQISLLPPVVADATPPGVSFGDVGTDVPANSTFKRGSDVVNVTFWSACPRNDLMTGGTFALVEVLEGAGGAWAPAYDDDDFCLRFKWWRPAALSLESHATIEWRIPETTIPGVYRIRHFGAAKNAIGGAINTFTGASSAFVVD